MSQGVEDLFGNKLDSESDGEFKDGIYLIKGVSMKKGVYRAGRWEGRPFARFMYELELPGGETQQVSQMLPWLPGKAFFEINFKLLTGMSLSDFNQHCRSQGFNDASAQSRFFLERFRGVQYEAEVRRKDRWYNVWEIRRRIPPEETRQEEAKEQELAQKAGAMSAGPTPGSEGELTILAQLAKDRGIDESQLQDLSQEHFALTLKELSQEQIEILQNRLTAEQPETDEGSEPKPEPPTG